MANRQDNSQRRSGKQNDRIEAEKSKRRTQSPGVYVQTTKSGDREYRTYWQVAKDYSIRTNGTPNPKKAQTLPLRQPVSTGVTPTHTVCDISYTNRRVERPIPGSSGAYYYTSDVEPISIHLEAIRKKSQDEKPIKIRMADISFSQPAGLNNPRQQFNAIRPGDTFGPSSDNNRPWSIALAKRGNIGDSNRIQELHHVFNMGYTVTGQMRVWCQETMTDELLPPGIITKCNIGDWAQIPLQATNGRGGRGVTRSQASSRSSSVDSTRSGADAFDDEDSYVSDGHSSAGIVRGGMRGRGGQGVRFNTRGGRGGGITVI